TRVQLAQWRTTWPRRVTEGSVACEAIRTRRVVRIPDIEASSALAGLTPETLANLRARGSRSVMAVPMFRQNEGIGAIGLAHRDVDAVSATHVDLLTTFADQAVIAIENVRLFTELQEKNRALTNAHAKVSEALEQQTATSEILRVISGTRTDVQPVFDAIVQSAVRLLGADSGMLARLAGDQFELDAMTSTDPAGDASQRALFPIRLDRDDPATSAFLDGTPINLVDAQSDLRMSEAVRASARARGSRSRVLIPLLRHGEAIGMLSVSRREAGGFAADEISLLQTFADQAVIAIENVRLFTELEA